MGEISHSSAFSCSRRRVDRRLAAAFESLSTLTHNDFPEENKLQERFSDLLRKLARFDQETPLSIPERSRPRARE